MIKYINSFTKYIYNKNKLVIYSGAITLLIVALLTRYSWPFNNSSIKNTDNKFIQDDIDTILNDPDTTSKYLDLNHTKCRSLDTEGLSSILNVKISGLQELTQTEPIDKNKITVCGLIAEISESDDDTLYTVQLTIRSYGDALERDSRYAYLVNYYKHANRNDIIIDKASRSVVVRVGEIYIVNMTIGNAIDGGILDYSNNDLIDWLLRIELE
jgi:hypothetical protein